MKKWNIPPTKSLKKFSQVQIEFLITHIAQIGRFSEVAKLFEDKFDQEVSTNYVEYLGKNDKYKDIIRKIREDFERNMRSSSYMANKRIRVEKYTDIYEKAMDLQDYRLANNVISNIREEIEPRSGNMNFVNIQNNEYVSLTLDEIRKKKAEVLERLERKKITSELPSGRSSSDSADTIIEEEKS